MDSAFMKIFPGLLKKLAAKPKITGRPPKTSTIASVAPLPRGVQAKKPAPPAAPLAKLPGM